MTDDEKNKLLNMLKTTRGQTDAIIHMVEDSKSCMDMMTQILAVQGLLKKINIMMMETHMRSCVKEAIGEKEEEKIDEILNILGRYYKN